MSRFFLKRDRRPHGAHTFFNMLCCVHCKNNDPQQFIVNAESFKVCTVCGVVARGSNEHAGIDKVHLNSDGRANRNEWRFNTQNTPSKPIISDMMECLGPFRDTLDLVETRAKFLHQRVCDLVEETPRGRMWYGKPALAAACIYVARREYERTNGETLLNNHMLIDMANAEVKRGQRRVDIDTILRYAWRMYDRKWTDIEPEVVQDPNAVDVLSMADTFTVTMSMNESWGVGFERKDDFWRVSFAEGPALKVGLQANDILFSINGVTLGQYKTIQDVTDFIRLHEDRVQLCIKRTE